MHHFLEKANGNSNERSSNAANGHGVDESATSLAGGAGGSCSASSSGSVGGVTAGSAGGRVGRAERLNLEAIRCEVDLSHNISTQLHTRELAGNGNWTHVGDVDGVGELDLPSSTRRLTELVLSYELGANGVVQHREDSERRRVLGLVLFSELATVRGRPLERGTNLVGDAGGRS